jgi:hypothetical protein
MRIPILRFTNMQSLSTAVVAAVFVLSACTVNVNKGEDGQDKKVDIQTPMGGLHVSNDADVRDVGLPIYPGARPKPKEDDDQDEKNANVNLSFGSFGLKVVAVEYLSDDAPDKILAYYASELKKYGKVLQCPGSTSADMHFGKSDSDSDSDSDELTCGDSKGSSPQVKIGNKAKGVMSDDTHGSGTELKAGTKHNQHIVSVKPNGKGADFALVYVRTRGKDTI